MDKAGGYGIRPYKNNIPTRINRSVKHGRASSIAHDAAVF
jgi:hypothetical protein